MNTLIIMYSLLLTLFMVSKHHHVNDVQIKGCPKVNIFNQKLAKVYQRSKCFIFWVWNFQGFCGEDPQRPSRFDHITSKPMATA